jgi:hypothetical protein
MTDSVSELLADLPLARPDSRRVDRVRSRCHAALARQRPRRSAERPRARRLWEPVVAGLGGLYLVVIILYALGLSGAL